MKEFALTIVLMVGIPFWAVVMFAPWIIGGWLDKLAKWLETYTNLYKLKQRARSLNETSGFYIDYTCADWFDQKISVYMPKEFYKNNPNEIKSIDFFWPENYNGKKCYSVLLEDAIKYVEENIKSKKINNNHEI